MARDEPIRSTAQLSLPLDQLKLGAVDKAFAIFRGLLPRMES